MLVRLGVTAMQLRTLFRCLVTIPVKLPNQGQVVTTIVTLTLLTIIGAQSMTHGKETSTRWQLPFTPAITFHQTIMTGVIGEVAVPMLSMSILI